MFGWKKKQRADDNRTETRLEVKISAPKPAPAPTAAPQDGPRISGPETLSLKLMDENRDIPLVFETLESMHHWYWKGEMKDYPFSLGGCDYPEYRSVFHERMENISDHVVPFLDIHGRRILRVHVEVPTFDEGDRDWDSYILYGIVPYGGDVDIVRIRGGYCIASIDVFRRLTEGREALELLLAKLEAAGQQD